MKMNIRLCEGNTLDAAQWDAFVTASPQGSVYALHGYATAIFPAWQAVILTDTAGKWLAIMPFAYQRKYAGFRSFNFMPYFAQTWGILFSPESAQGSFHDQFSDKREMVLAILGALPKVRKFAVQFSPAFDYPFPFHWAGYQLLTRYTYQLRLQGDDLWAACAKPLQRQIRKTEKNGLQIILQENTDTLAALVRENERDGNKIYLGKEAHYTSLTRLHRYLADAGLGHVLAATDAEGHTLAAGLYADWKGTRHYLTGAYSPNARDSGAMSRLMWEAILAAQKEGLHTFDFEGSMIEGVEGFFRKFGAFPIPYLRIEHG